MITSLRLVNFKNFADETLNLGPFTLIVGANASGKSNIRDAFRFLNGIGSRFTLAEILGGRHDAEWQPIRGGANEIIRFDQDEFSLEVEMQSTSLIKVDIRSIRYFIRIRRDDENGGQFRVVGESLIAFPRTPDSTVSGTLYTSDLSQDSATDAQEKDLKLSLYLPVTDETIEVASDQPGLSQLPSSLEALIDAKQAEIIDVEQAEIIDVEQAEIDDVEQAKVNLAMLKTNLAMLKTNLDKMKTNLAMLKTNSILLAVLLELVGTQFLEPSPERMREPSFPGAIGLGDSGDHLPTVLEAICADPERNDVLLSWLHELTPMDVKGLGFPRDLNGRVNLQIREANGRSVSAYSASDGTLRFLAMLAALLNEDYAGLYCFEEIDTGIHPARLSLLLDLIERQTAKGKIQVVATTHSPDVLNLINDRTFENTSVVYRDEDSADAVIRRVAELPNAKELRKSQGLGRLHAGGWMENILSFAEADREEQKSEE